MSTIATSTPPKGHDKTVSFLNGAIEALNLAKSKITPARSAYSSTSDLLGIIKVRSPPHDGNFLVHIFQDSVVNEQDYVELGLSCADVCQALERGLEGGQTSELSRPMLAAIEKLTT